MVLLGAGKVQSWGGAVWGRRRVRRAEEWEGQPHVRISLHVSVDGLTAVCECA